jgi:hypothetical protein
MVGSAAPGWYPDPGSSNFVRFWDGQRWTEHTAPAQPAASPSGPAPGANPPPGFGVPAPSAPGRPSVLPPPPVSLPSSTAATVRWLIVAAAALGAVAMIVITFTFVHATDQAFSRVARLSSVIPASRAPVYRPPFDSNGDPVLKPFDAREPQTDPKPSAVPAAIYAVPHGDDVITPAGARAVFDAIWKLRATAIAANDRKTLGEIETGSALAIDAGRGCGCAGHTDQFGPASGTTVAVQHQRAFPASFMVSTDTTFNFTPWSAWLVFTRSSSATAWRLAFAGGGHPLVADAEMPRWQLAADGYAKPVPRTVLTRGRQLAPALATFWQDAKDGNPESEDAPLWDTGTLTNEWAGELRKNPQGKTDASNHITWYYRFAAAPNTSTYLASFDDGSYLACGAVVEQETAIAAVGTRINQDPVIEYWDHALAPGKYRAFIETDEYTPCFTFDPMTIDVGVNGVVPPDTVAAVGVK